MYAVILAGGSGRRLWPLSRLARPKQFVEMMDGRSLLENSIQRLGGIFDPAHILVVGMESQRDVLLEETDGLVSPENILLEPVARNTAPSIALASAYLCDREDSVLCVLPSDHYIGDREKYAAVLRRAMAAAETHDVVATVGIKPTGPSTNYGYIHFGDPAEGIPGARKIREFVEKPNRELAQRFCDDGNFYWNGGIFVSRCSHLRERFRTLLPDLFGWVDRAYDCMARGDREEMLANYSHVQNIAFDYGIMERSRGGIVFHGDFPWSDLGSYSALYDIMPKDDAGNVLLAGQLLAENARRLTIYSRAREKLVVVSGLSGVIVIDMDDVLYVCDENSAGRTKEILETLDANGRSYLE